MSRKVKRRGTLPGKYLPGTAEARHRRRPRIIARRASDRPFSDRLPAIGGSVIGKSIAGIKSMLWNATSRGEIFVIDEDTASREALSGALQAVGYQTICFADGAALLSQIRSRVPDCVFLEVQMSERRGIELLKKLREENCPAPTFVTSANGDIATAVEAIRSGAVDFIEKPVDGNDLVERMEAAIEELRRSGGEHPDIATHLPGCEPFTLRERDVLARIACDET